MCVPVCPFEGRVSRLRASEGASAPGPCLNRLTEFAGGRPCARIRSYMAVCGPFAARGVSCTGKPFEGV